MQSRFKILALATTVVVLAAVARADRPDSPGGGHGNPGGGPPVCDEAAVADATALVASLCPCAGQTNELGELVAWRTHGRYVRCLAQATRDVVRDSAGALTRRCLRESVRCAARSTCGRREGVVACTRAFTGLCTDGRCADGSECASEEDCSRSACSFSRSAETCTALGGEPGLGSCCAPTPVGSPSGAFVDGVRFF